MGIIIQNFIGTMENIVDKEIVINGLNQIRDRLIKDVTLAFEQRGHSFGTERFHKWKERFIKFLDEYLQGESDRLKEKLIHYGFVSIGGETDVQSFWRNDGENMISYIDSLIIDINNDEYDLPKTKKMQSKTEKQNELNRESVFIVHGRNNEAKQETARFIEQLGFEAIILHEQASKGKTIIEKIEENSNVGFAVVLYTPCDDGKAKTQSALNDRARQNVVFEHGYLIGKIGRQNVCALVKGDIEKPNDISGVVYINMDSHGAWKTDLIKEMKESDYVIDANRLL